MRYLTLVRHAKSDWDNDGASDHDRPLNERGKRVAPIMGRYLARFFKDEKRGVPAPDCVVSSTALRARATAEQLAGALMLDEADIGLEPEIYEASAEDIIEVVQNLPEDFHHALLVGHNPGMQSCAERLMGYGNEAGQIGNLPTCGTVVMRMAIDYWAMTDTGTAQLVEYLTPKELGIE